VECDPSTEIVFMGDFLHPLSNVFTVRNKSQADILFKIKTTSPHRYEVRPHHGQVAPQSEVSVTMTLLPFNYKPEQKYSDKFLLQVCALNDLNRDYSKRDIWSNVPKEELYSKKLKSKFVYKSDSSSEETERSAPTTPLVQTPVLGSPRTPHELSTKRRKLNELESELRKLRDDHMVLRAEKQAMELKVQNMSQDATNNGFKSEFPTSSKVQTPPTLAHQAVPIVFALVIGVILGKFFLQF